MTHLPGLHRKKGEEREENDFYATHPSAIIKLMDVLGWQEGGKLIRENSCGQGHLSQMLDLYGHKVISTDLIDRGYGIGGIDFLEPHPLDDLNYDAVIMNPPYKLALEFVKKSLTIAPTVCAFLRIAFLESARRKDFFKNYPPKYVCVFIDRMASSKSGVFDENEASTVCYAWFIWEDGCKDAPQILWI